MTIKTQKKNLVKGARVIKYINKSYCKIWEHQAKDYLKVKQENLKPTQD